MSGPIYLPGLWSRGVCWATVTLPARFKKLLLHCDSHIAALKDKQPSDCALPPMLRAAPSLLCTPTHQLSIISNLMKISGVRSVQSLSCQHEPALSLIADQPLSSINYILGSTLFAKAVEAFH